MGGGDSTLTSGMAVLPESGAKKEPNKAPEPTAFAVTPRAISRISEVNLLIANRNAARGAPAKAVAHL